IRPREALDATGRRRSPLVKTRQPITTSSDIVNSEWIMPSRPYTGARWLKMKPSEFVQFGETLGKAASIVCVSRSGRLPLIKKSNRRAGKDDIDAYFPVSGI